MISRMMSIQSKIEPPEGMVINGLFLDSLIPAMTGYTTPSGQVLSGGNINNSYPEWQAFNKEITDFIYMTSQPGWIGYDFKTPTLVSKYLLKPRVLPANYYLLMPLQWEFQTSSDSITWTTRDIRAFTWPGSNARLFNLTNPVTCNMFRIWCAYPSQWGTEIEFSEIDVA
jgi:hypothetical protein